MADKSRFIENCRQKAELLSDNTSIEERESTLWVEQRNEEYILSALIKENASVAQNQNEFRKKCQPHEDRLTEIYKELDALKAKTKKRIKRKNALEIMVGRLSSETFTTDSFNGETFAQLVEKITVHENGKMTFRFMNGVEIEI